MRQLHPELGATGHARHPDRAAVTVDDGFRDRQTEAAASPARRPRRVDFVEAIEHVREVARVDAASGIDHTQGGASALDRRLQLHAPAARRVPQRVGDEVLDHLLDPIGIAGQLIGRRGHLADQRHASRRGLTLMTADDVGEQTFDGEQADLDRADAVLVAREIEEVL